MTSCSWRLLQSQELLEWWRPPVIVGVLSTAGEKSMRREHTLNFCLVLAAWRIRSTRACTMVFLTCGVWNINIMSFYTITRTIRKVSHDNWFSATTNYGMLRENDTRKTKLLHTDINVVPSIKDKLMIYTKNEYHGKPKYLILQAFWTLCSVGTPWLHWDMLWTTCTRHIPRGALINSPSLPGAWQNCCRSCGPDWRRVLPGIWPTNHVRQFQDVLLEDIQKRWK